MAEELRIVLRNYGKIDPLKIDDYIAQGGYKALEKARTMDPKALIEEVKKSNLRGRGGPALIAGRSGLLLIRHQAMKNMWYAMRMKVNQEPIKTG